LAPAFDSPDNFAMIGEEAVKGGLKVNDGMDGSALQAVKCDRKE
jgi:hypothetical protein